MPYRQHFGLKENPFTDHPDPRFFYLTDQHQSALEKSSFVADNKLGLGVTTGTPGTGKTTLSRIMFQKFSDARDFKTVLLADPIYKTDNRMLRAIIQEFDVGETQKAMSDSLQIFADFLEKTIAKEGKSCLLIVDHGERMKEELYALINDLMELRGKDDKGLLQVMLFGREEMHDKMRDPRSKSIHTKISMNSAIDPLTFDELTRKIKFRFRVAGLDDHPFSDDALKELYIKSRGVPRASIRLADAAMHQALLSNSTKIDRDMVLKAEQALGMDHDQLILQQGEKLRKAKKGNRGRPPLKPKRPS